MAQPRNYHPLKNAAIEGTKAVITVGGTAVTKLPPVITGAVADFVAEPVVNAVEAGAKGAKGLMQRHIPTP